MINASQVKELREKTGAGMMDCKKALTEANGDFENAITWLRKKGLSQASKKADRATAEGLTAVRVQDKVGVVVEVNSETDFVARNDQFQKLVQEVSELALEASNVQELEQKKTKNDQTVSEAIVDSIATIGENIALRRMQKLEVSQGVVASYVHNATVENLGKISVLVALESASSDSARLSALGKQIAMHIAAANPKFLNSEDIDQSMIDKEREILVEQTRSLDKPAEVIQKTIDGRIRKFVEEVVLLEQVFVIDGKTKIRDLLAQVSKELGAEVKIPNFIRFELGEGIVLENKNFADEVASLTQG